MQSFQKFPFLLISPWGIPKSHPCPFSPYIQKPVHFLCCSGQQTRNLSFSNPKTLFIVFLKGDSFPSIASQFQLFPRKPIPRASFLRFAVSELGFLHSRVSLCDLSSSSSWGRNWKSKELLGASYHILKKIGLILWTLCASSFNAVMNWLKKTFFFFLITVFISIWLELGF